MAVAMMIRESMLGQSPACAAGRQAGMLYLSGSVTAEAMAHPQCGVILTPNMGNRPDLSATAWAADNGCFSQGERFRVPAFLAYLDSQRAYRSTCLFAVAPDVLGDARATLRRSAPVLPVLRAKGWRAALVAQNGLEALAVPWGTFDALFIGGDTAWKLGPAAARLAAEAKVRGLWVHMGRVNSWRRLRYASEIGCDSVDGTYLKFSPDANWPRLLRWLRHLRALESADLFQAGLWGGATA